MGFTAQAPTLASHAQTPIPSHVSDERPAQGHAGKLSKHSRPAPDGEGTGGCTTGAAAAPRAPGSAAAAAAPRAPRLLAMAAPRGCGCCGRGCTRGLYTRGVRLHHGRPGPHHGGCGCCCGCTTGGRLLRLLLRLHHGGCGCGCRGCTTGAAAAAAAAAAAPRGPGGCTTGTTGCSCIHGLCWNHSSGCTGCE